MSRFLRAAACIAVAAQFEAKMLTPVSAVCGCGGDENTETADKAENKPDDDGKLSQKAKEEAEQKKLEAQEKVKAQKKKVKKAQQDKAAVDQEKKKADEKAAAIHKESEKAKLAAEKASKTKKAADQKLKEAKETEDPKAIKEAEAAQKKADEDDAKAKKEAAKILEEKKAAADKAEALKKKAADAKLAEEKATAAVAEEKDSLKSKVLKMMIAKVKKEAKGAPAADVAQLQVMLDVLSTEELQTILDNIENEDKSIISEILRDATVRAEMSKCKTKEEMIKIALRTPEEADMFVTLAEFFELDDLKAMLKGEVEPKELIMRMDNKEDLIKMLPMMGQNLGKEDLAAFEQMELDEIKKMISGESTPEEREALMRSKAEDKAREQFIAQMKEINCGEAANSREAAFDCSQKLEHMRTMELEDLKKMAAEMFKEHAQKGASLSAEASESKGSSPRLRGVAKKSGQSVIATDALKMLEENPDLLDEIAGSELGKKGEMAKFIREMGSDAAANLKKLDESEAFAYFEKLATLTGSKGGKNGKRLSNQGYSKRGAN